MAKQERRTEQICIRLSESERDHLTRAAEAFGMTISQWMRHVARDAAGLHDRAKHNRPRQSSKTER